MKIILIFQPMKKIDQKTIKTKVISVCKAIICNFVRRNREERNTVIEKPSLFKFLKKELSEK